MDIDWRPWPGLLAIDLALDPAGRVVPGYVVPSALILLSLLAVLLLDLWLIQREVRRQGGAQEAAGSQRRRTLRVPNAEIGRAERPTNPGFV